MWGTTDIVAQVSHVPVRLLSRSNKWLFNYISLFTWRQAMQSSLPSWTCRDPSARKIRLPGPAEFLSHFLHSPVARMAHLQTHNEIHPLRRMLCIRPCIASVQQFSVGKGHILHWQCCFSALLLRAFLPASCRPWDIPLEQTQLRKDGWNQNTQPYSWRPSALWT